MRYKIVIGGEAGFGIMTTGLVLSKIATRTGFDIFDYVQYPSLIRGGHNAYEIIVSDTPVHSILSGIDLLICLNEFTYTYHKSELKDSSLVVYDPQDFTPPQTSHVFVPVPFKDILKKEQGSSKMKNTVLIGAAIALLGADIAIMDKILEQEFGKKGERIVTLNKKFLRMGYDYVKESNPQACSTILSQKANEWKEKVVMTGNDAFSLASVMAGAQFYAAYPMTPSSSVLATLASYQDKAPLVVRHSEDEIAVINSAIGASFAGVRSSVGTSGGGFALMVEGVSLAGVTETPIVIFLSQRPGPATGMPTWTEQGDLLFAVHSGHGEFPKIVLAPGDMKEMIALTLEAYNLADIYQTPVIVMSDMFLSEGHISINTDEIRNIAKGYKEDRGKLVTLVDGKKYDRYVLTDDGVSPRLIPGFKGVFYQANSYSHDETGHTTEDGNIRAQHVEKLFKKQTKYLAENFQGPTVFGDVDSATHIFVCWGSVKLPLLDALTMLNEKREKNNTYAVLHFHHVYPLHREKVQSYFSKKTRYILVENNHDGQFGKLLQQETGIEVTERIRRYDGRPISADQIVSYITSNV